jgi:hypothetical protein
VKDQTTPASDFERQAQQVRQGFAAEFLEYMWRSKKWWISPIIIMLLLLAGLIILGSTGAAPFIYTLF